VKLSRVGIKAAGIKGIIVATNKQTIMLKYWQLTT